MALLQGSQISLAYGDRDILDKVSIQLNEKTRAALAGANGCGKSTLMKILCGLIPPDSGTVSRTDETVAAYLPQTGISFGNATPPEEAEKGFERFRLLEEEKQRLEARTAEAGADWEKAARRAHEIEEILLESGYYHRREQIGRVLKGLGFKESDFTKPSGAFSGGWQMRIALARILLSRPHILLLDEPTNYLDMETREWLADFLNKYEGGILLISHDRYFLDVTVNETYELFNGKLKRYRGNYSSYEKQRKEEIDLLIRRAALQQEEIERSRQYIERFRAKATKAASVKSRERMLEKMTIIEIPDNLKKIHFRFPPAPHCGKEALIIEALRKSYGPHEVIRGLDLVLRSGEKLAVTGVNGAGKSTLLRILAGKDAPTSGKVRCGTDVRIGYFAQDYENDLNARLTVQEEAEAAAPAELRPKVNSLLGAFLFSGDDIQKPVSVLSGGEKNRLTLLKLLMQPANLLILDEPTNHLDLHSKDVLLTALKDYTGTVVFVSHDRAFIQGLATAVLDLTETGARFYGGDYDYFLWKKAQTAADTPAPAVRNGSPAPTGRSSAPQPAAPESRGAAAGDDHRRQKEQRNLINRLQKESETLLAQIDDTEAELKRLHAEWAREECYSDPQKSAAVAEAVRAAEAEQERLTARWEAVEEELAAARKG